MDKKNQTNETKIESLDKEIVDQPDINIKPFSKFKLNARGTIILADAYKLFESIYIMERVTEPFSKIRGAKAKSVLSKLAFSYDKKLESSVLDIEVYIDFRPDTVHDLLDLIRDMKPIDINDICEHNDTTQLAKLIRTLKFIDK